MSDQPNPYEVLGVAKDATDGEIKTAYRRKCKDHHPDREQGDEQKMLAVRGAYDVLKDRKRRERFDKTGETKQDKPIADLAQSILLEAFQHFILNAGEHVNPIDELRRMLYAKLQNEGNALQDMRQKLAAVEKRAKQLKHRESESDDLWQGIVGQLRTNLVNTVQRGEAITKAIPIAIEMLKQYEGKPLKTSSFSEFATTETTFTWVR